MERGCRREDILILLNRGRGFFFSHNEGNLRMLEKKYQIMGKGKYDCKTL